MFNINLINIFEGLVRNYDKFNLTNKDDKFEILKKELNYIVIVGQVLGYYSVLTGINEEYRTTKNIIEVKWKIFDEKYTISEPILCFSRELDLMQDTNAIYKLTERINTQIRTKAFIQIIDIPFKGRIDYLNKILSECKRIKYVDVLIIYKIYNIREESNYYYSYLFEESNLINQKNAHSYYDSLGFLKMKFI